MKDIIFITVVLLMLNYLRAENSSSTPVKVHDILILLDSDDLPSRMKGAARAREVEDPQQIVPELIDSTLNNIFKEDYLLMNYNSGGDANYYGIVIASLKQLIKGEEMTDFFGEGQMAEETFVELYDLSQIYKATYPVSYKSHEVFQKLEEGIAQPDLYINELRKINFQTMVETGEIVLSEYGGPIGRTKNMGLLPEDVRISNNLILSEIRATENLKDNESEKSNLGIEHQLPGATSEVITRNTTTPNTDRVQPVEVTPEQSSQWWLWLVGALVVLGGLAVVVRRKS